MQLGARILKAFSVYMTVAHNMGDNAANYSILANWARALPYLWLIVRDWNIGPTPWMPTTGWTLPTAS